MLGDRNMKRYKTIYADPPWMEKGGGKIKRGANKHYPLMKTKDIINLPIQNLIDDNCHLYLWVTNAFLQDGLDVMKAWGFKYKTMITWFKGRSPINEYIHWFLKKDVIDENDYVNLYNAGYTIQSIANFSGNDEIIIKNYLKDQGIHVKKEKPIDLDEDNVIEKYDNPGLGQYFRGVTESCLFGVKGNLPYKTNNDGKRIQGLTGFVAPRTIHSRKPQEMRIMIERVSYPPYLELFARQDFEGWDHWGNELQDNIILNSALNEK